MSVLDLESVAYIWPDESKRRGIASDIFKRIFTNCVGIMDGTLLNLDSRPTEYGETHFTRKGFYAVHMLVVCDHNGRIIYYVVGWPRSVHVLQ